jgi:NNP family nitrate/nitrite transporter-like MFS transporter
MPTFLASTYEIQLSTSGLVTALFPAIGLVARPVGGVLSEQGFDGRSLPVVGISFLGAGIVALALVFGGSLAFMAAGLVAAGFAIQLQFGLLYTLVQRYVPRSVGGTAVAVVSTVGWLGTFAGPPIVGAIIELTNSYATVFLTGILLAGGGAITVLALSEPPTN